MDKRLFKIDGPDEVELELRSLASSDDDNCDDKAEKVPTKSKQSQRDKCVYAKAMKPPSMDAKAKSKSILPNTTFLIQKLEKMDREIGDSWRRSKDKDAQRDIDTKACSSKCRDAMAFYRNERTKIAKTWADAKALMISELLLWDNSYKKLTKDVDEYKRLYKECKKKRNEFEDELDRVKKELKEAKRSAGRSTSRERRTQTKIDSLTTENANLLAKQREFTEEVQKLKAALESNKKLQQNNANVIAQRDASITRLQDSYKQLNEQHSKVAQEHSKCSKTQADSQQLIVEKSTEIQKLGEQVSQLEKKLEANEQQLTEKNNNVAQLLVKLAKKDKELEESRYESRKLGDHLIKRAEELKNCEAENAKLTEKLQIKLENERELREKLTQQMSIKFKGEALIRTLKGERDDYKEQLEKTEARMKMNDAFLVIAAKDNKIKELEEKLEENVKKLQSSQGKEEELARAYESHKAKISEEFNQWQSLVAAKEKKVSDYMDQLAEKIGEIEAKKAQLDTAILLTSQQMRGGTPGSSCQRCRDYQKTINELTNDKKNLNNALNLLTTMQQLHQQRERTEMWTSSTNSTVQINNVVNQSGIVQRQQSSSSQDTAMDDGGFARALKRNVKQEPADDGDGPPQNKFFRGAN